MRKKEVQDMIFLTLQDELAGHGFRYVKSGEGKLIRRFKGGWHVISAAMDAASLEPWFDLLVEIRLDVVANIYIELAGVLPGYHKDVFSAIANLGYFWAEPGGRNERGVVNFDSPETLMAEVRALFPLLNQKVIPLLDACTDVAGLDRLLNSGNTPPFSVQNVLDKSDATNALLAAKLAGNPHFEQLVSQFERQFRAESEALWTHYSATVDYIRHYQGGVK